MAQFTALFIAASAWGADYQTTVLQDNPVGYWRLGSEPVGGIVPNLGGVGSGGDGTASDTTVFGHPGALAADADGSAQFDGGSSKTQVDQLPQWQKVPGSVSPATITPSGLKFYRVQQP
ncbi:MAG: hypothetical protein ACKV19_21920 [Verrucomicrobiales bacterium]